ncbi:dihydrofolate reductase [Owenweeksia hongkongensis DSM 17368]|uniref:Dihydrofolate reductase n=1 Tax=Owenweeksia hongkongensis (strain DSM 17368 / CIP 108786 / JCM 12287 / NRRL B-23963 / UST20020801) TaxID=926562 RepID=G8R1W9_OWEHD|nr:dihydrofolate reductase [Owenweeksia hongkongensis]AEV33919.1 dihydrofolate reductase [Owenweeksia hongkongensis DSM 17368]
MNLTIIAAMAKGRVIGKDNDLIWHLPDDLKHFKNLTKGHHVIMGRKTYQSMGKPLPGRTNIVITRQKDFKADGCILVNNIEEGIQKAEGDSQPFIIGGGEIYKQALKYAQTMELTEVNGEFDGDTFFPTFDEKQWKEVSRTHHPVDEKHKYSFDFIQYSKL